LALVISETLQNDIRSGVKVALAPIITDFPIIILTLFVFSKFSDFNNVLGLISLIGAFVILLMGYESLTTKGITVNTQENTPKSLSKGVLVNVLSPHPYLFWFTVGAPTMAKAMDQSLNASFAFITGFYVFLVGSKIMLAVLAGKSKSFLEGNLYIYTMRFLGLVLCLFAIILFRDGLKLLEVI
jgi:threonine/homoserine/homoserine lactone efflux protein